MKPYAWSLCALAAAVSLSGCGAIDRGVNPATRANAADLSTPTASSGLGDNTDDDGTATTKPLPDVCALLSRTDVTTLTGKAVTEVDADNGQPADTTRYCQWQLNGGLLAVFLTYTTVDDYHLAVTDGTKVDGVDGADEAYARDGHLWVRRGGLQLDVYSHGGTQGQDLGTEKVVARSLMPRI